MEAVLIREAKNRGEIGMNLKEEWGSYQFPELEIKSDSRIPTDQVHIDNEITAEHSPLKSTYKWERMTDKASNSLENKPKRRRLDTVNSVKPTEEGTSLITVKQQNSVNTGVSTVVNL